MTSRLLNFGAAWNALQWKASHHCPFFFFCVQKNQSLASSKKFQFWCTFLLASNQYGGQPCHTALSDYLFKSCYCHFFRILHSSTIFIPCTYVYIKYNGLPLDIPLALSAIWMSLGLTCCLASLKMLISSAACLILLGVKKVYAVPVLVTRPVRPMRWT